MYLSLTFRETGQKTRLLKPQFVTLETIKWGKKTREKKKEWSSHGLARACVSAGQAALPLLQHPGQGNGAHQVLPRVLLRMSQDALRHQTEEVPQVQLCLRRQRLPPHLHHLIRRAAGGDSRLNQSGELVGERPVELRRYLMRHTLWEGGGGAGVYGGTPLQKRLERRGCRCRGQQFVQAVNGVVSESDVL